MFTRSDQSEAAFSGRRETSRPHVWGVLFFAVRTWRNMGKPGEIFSQPFNAMMLLAAITASFLFLPGQNSGGDQGPSSTLLKFLHLSSVCIHFGTQMWVTFIAGLTMFHNLPRHTFGHVQSHLFPKYFTMGSILGLVAMVTYMYEHRHGDMTTHQKIETGILAAVFVSDLLNAALVGPHSLELMTQQYMIEKEHGHGHEIGTHPTGKIQKDPKYQKVRREFMKFHGISSLVNMVGLVGNGIHVYYLASQLAGI